MLQVVSQNLLSPAVLFFVIGLIAAIFKSDLKFPAALSDTLSIYLLIAIGLKGGLELSEYSLKDITNPLIGTLLLGIITPFIAYFICRLCKIDRSNAAALAATYGSVSIVTFGAITSFLQDNSIHYEKFMTAMVVVLESPAILIAVLIYASAQRKSFGIDSAILKESLLGKSILLMIGGLLVGLICGHGALPIIKPLFVDLYKSVLILFLLGMGIMAGERLTEIKVAGFKLLSIAILFPIVFGTIGTVIGYVCGLSIGGTAIMAILGASASYIAAPAAIRQSIPDANPSFYLATSLGVTFPFNLVFGIPLFIQLATFIHQ